MAADDKWYFTKDQLAKTPSRLNGYDADKELSCRQQAANFIQDMGQRLQVTQLCINTAIVYMHRFYMFHSFTHFHRNAIASAALFLAAKVEEQPRKLEYVIKIAQMCLHREQPPMDVKSELYLEQAQELVVNENILLQTLGFDVAIDHPHTHVVKCCQLVKASKDLAQTSYFMASNSLHLTTMCLQYKPTVVACFCIHLACKWSNWEIRHSSEGRPWFWYVDKTVTQELLEQLTEEFLAIFEKCPSRFKKKIIAISNNQSANIPSFAYDNDKKRNGEGSNSTSQASHHLSGSGGSNSTDDKRKDIPQRYPPDYKKPPHFPHHPRTENSGVSSKSSCMFAPPMRTSTSTTNPLHTLSNSSSSGALIQPRTKASEPVHSSHHRPPRRPPVPPASSGVHSAVPSSVINMSTKAPSPILPSTAPVNALTPVIVPPGSHSAPNPVISSAHLHHPPPPPLLPPIEDKKPPEPVYKKYTEGKIMSLIQEAPLPTPISPPPPTPAPPPVKVERSIFSPEKSTPPTESIKPPTPGRIDLSSSLPDTLAFETKVKPKGGSSLPTPSPTPPPQPIHPKPAIIPPAPPHGAVPTVGVPPPPAPAEPSTPKEEKPDTKSLDPTPQSTEEHSSRSDQKKKKKKHKEHKEKHKDKHKHKHKSKDPEPIVITIPKEKLNLPPVIAPVNNSEQQGLKIKIAKDKISGAISPGPPSSGLKIKISKDKIKESSRKRDRSGDGEAPPAKYHRPNGTTLQVNKVVETPLLSNSECFQTPPPFKSSSPLDPTKKPLSHPSDHSLSSPKHPSPPSKLLSPLPSLNSPNSSPKVPKKKRTRRTLEVLEHSPPSYKPDSWRSPLLPNPVSPLPPYKSDSSFVPKTLSPLPPSRPQNPSPLLPPSLTLSKPSSPLLSNCLSPTQPTSPLSKLISPVIPSNPSPLQGAPPSQPVCHSSTKPPHSYQHYPRGSYNRPSHSHWSRPSRPLAPRGFSYRGRPRGRHIRPISGPPRMPHYNRPLINSQYSCYPQPDYEDRYEYPPLASSHPQPLPSHPQNVPSHPQNLHSSYIPSHPQNMNSHIPSHHQNMHSHIPSHLHHPSNIPSHPQQLPSHPQHLPSHPQHIPTHPCPPIVSDPQFPVHTMPPYTFLSLHHSIPIQRPPLPDGPPPATPPPPPPPD